MSEMICENASQCTVHNCTGKLPHRYSEVCAKLPCNINGGIAGSKCIPYTPKEGCSKCGQKIGLGDMVAEDEDGNLYHAICPKKEVKMQNPSPRDIFQHIKTNCEWRSYKEFLKRFNTTEPDNPLTDLDIDCIKSNHPDWYSWLVSKGLVQRKMVKKVLIADVKRWYRDGMLITLDAQCKPIHPNWDDILDKPGKLTFEWEEEE